MKTHKLKNRNGRFGFSVCGRALHSFGGQASTTWKDVDCKQCLAHKKNIKKQKKYSLVITEKQATKIIKALDLYTRLCTGQVSRLDDITDKDKEGFHLKISHGTLSMLQREMFPSLSGINSSHGIHSPKISDEIREGYDIFKVMMYEFNKGKGPINVYADKVRQASKQKLPEFEEIKNV